MSASSAELLKGLLREIGAHARRHGEQRDAREAADDRCRAMLLKVKKIWTSIERFYLLPVAVKSAAAAQVPSDGNLLRPALELMKVLLEGRFCPHAKAVFGYGEVGAIAPPFAKLFVLLAEPEALEAGIFGLLTGNLRALLRLLANADMPAVLGVLQDLVDLVRNSGVPDTPDRLTCFHKLCAARVRRDSGARFEETEEQASQSTSQDACQSHDDRDEARGGALPNVVADELSVCLTVGSVERKAYLRSVVCATAGLFAMDLASVLAPQPSFYSLIMSLRDQLGNHQQDEWMAVENERHGCQGPLPGWLAPETAAAEALRLTVKGLEPVVGCATHSIRTMRAALLGAACSASMDWAKGYWDTLGRALDDALCDHDGLVPVSEDEAYMVSTCLQRLAAANLDQARATAIAARALLSHFRRRLVRAPETVRCLEAILRGNLVAIRDLHADLGRCIAAALAMVLREEADSGTAFLSHAVSLARKQRRRAPLHQSAAVAAGAPPTAMREEEGFAIAPRLLSDALARARPGRKRPRPAVSRAENADDTGPQPTPPSGSTLCLNKEALFASLVGLFASALSVQDGINSGSNKAGFGDAALSILVQTFVLAGADVPRSHGAVQLVFDLCVKWLASGAAFIKSGPPSGEHTAQTMELLADISLALAYQLQQEAARPEPALTESLFRAAAGVEEVLRASQAFQAGAAESSPGHKGASIAQAMATAATLPGESVSGFCEVALSIAARRGERSVPPSGVRVREGLAGLTEAFRLPVKQRLAVVASSFPVDWFCSAGLESMPAGDSRRDFARQATLQSFANVCKSLLSAGLISPEPCLKARCMVQIPGLLANLRVRADQVEQHCAEAIERDAAASVQPAEASATPSRARRGGGSSSHGVAALIGFINKLGPWLASACGSAVMASGEQAAHSENQGPQQERAHGDNCSAEDQQRLLQAVLACTHTCMRLMDTPLLGTEACTCRATPSKSALTAAGGPDRSVARGQTCNCAASRYLGDVPGMLLLFKPWLSVACFKALENASVPAPARVAILRASCHMFRRVVNAGIERQKPTLLLQESFGEVFSVVLELLEDEEETVRTAVASEISLFVDGCGGGVEFRTRRPAAAGPVRELGTERYSETAPGRCDLLRSMFRKDKQTENVSAFMKKLRQVVANNQRKQASSAWEGRGRPVLHALLCAVGTIGCTADVTYAVEGVHVGANFLSWSLLMLTQQYAISLAWTNELLAKLRALHMPEDDEDKEDTAMPDAPAADSSGSGSGSGSGGGANEARTATMAHLTHQLDAAESLRGVVCEQFERIAASHGFARGGSGGGGGRGVAIRQLFAWMRKDLYPQLFVMLFSEPLVSKAPEALEELLFSVFELSADGDSLDALNPTQVSLNSTGVGGGATLRAKVTTGAEDPSPNQEGERRARFLGRFVRDSLPFVLPDLIKEMNIPVLYRIAQCLDGTSDIVEEEQRHSIVRHMIIDHYEAWIVEMVELLAEDTAGLQNTSEQLGQITGPEGEGQRAAGRQSVNNSRGYLVWSRILNFAHFSIKEIFDLCLKTILSRVVFRLVDAAGAPNTDAEKILALLAHYSLEDPAARRRNKADASVKSQPPASDRLIERLIHSQFMFLMGVLSECIQDKWKPTGRRCHALRCAQRLQALLGCEIDAYLPKILPTVKTALQETDANIQEAACELLHKSVTSLSVAALKANLSSVVACLLPCLGVVPSDAGKGAEHATMTPSGGGSSSNSSGGGGGGGGSKSPNSRRFSPPGPAEDDVARQRREEESTLRARVQAKAVRTLEWLVVTRRADLREGFANLRELLPTTHPALATVSEVLREEGGKSSVGERIRQMIKLIQHESDSVRLLALGELRGILATHARGLHDVLLDKSERGSSNNSQGSSVPPQDAGMKTASGDRRECSLISELIGTLLRISRSVAAGGNTSHSKARTTRLVRLACSECLGEVGAVDPARLDLALVQRSLSSRRLAGDGGAQARAAGEGERTGLSLDLGNESLAAIVVEDYLVNMLRAAPDPNSHMQVGMAIQELLLYFRSLGYVASGTYASQSASATPRRASPRAAQFAAATKPLEGLFRNAEVVEIVRPFCDTNYNFAQDGCVLPEPQGRGGRRFFGPEVSFETSVGDWFAFLAMRCKGDQSKILQALLVLQTYSGATDLLLFLLPYALQNALCLAPNGDLVGAVREEIMDVLRDTWLGDVCPGDEDAPAQCELGSGAAPNDVAYAGSAGRIKMSALAMFSVLDTLSSWVSQMNINLRHASRGGMGTASANDYARKVQQAYHGDFQNKQQVATLLHRVPMRCLAEASYRIGAYARALQYFEKHVRTTHALDKGMGGVAPGAWRSRRAIQMERDEITFLHSVYAALESEPDGLVGVTSLRSRHDGGPGTGYVMGRSTHTVSKWPVADDQKRARQEIRLEYLLDSRQSLGKVLRPPAGAQPGDGGQPTLLEKIYELEFDGRWDEAIACYERIFAQSRASQEERALGSSATRIGDSPRANLDLGTPKTETPSPTGAQPPSAITPRSKRRKQGAGIFPASLTAAEQSPQQRLVNAAEIRMHHGRLNCLRRLSHLDLVVSAARGTAMENSGLEAFLKPYVSESLWRLGRWEELAAEFGAHRQELCSPRGGSSSAASDTDDNGPRNQSTRALAWSEMLHLGPGNTSAAYSQALSRAMLAIAQFSAAAEEGAERQLRASFAAQLTKARLEVMEILSASSMESYAHAYPHLLRLQALSELKDGWDIVATAKQHRSRPVVGVAGTSPMSKSVAQIDASRMRLRKKLEERGWEDRVKITAPSFEIREELLEVRRVVFQLAGLKAEEMSSWLSLAKTARLAGYRQNCLAALQRVQECADTILCGAGGRAVASVAVGAEIGGGNGGASLRGGVQVEAEVALCKAKMYLAELVYQAGGSATGNGSQRSGTRPGAHEALMVLEPVRMEPRVIEAEILRAHPQLQKCRAKSLVMATMLMAESAQGDAQSMIKRCKIAQRVRSNWEDGHFHLAKLVERFVPPSDSEKELAGQAGATSRADRAALSEQQILVHLLMKEYGKSLEHGAYEHLHESLPRLLTLWYKNTEDLYPKVLAAQAARQSSRSQGRRGRGGSGGGGGGGSGGKSSAAVLLSGAGRPAKGQGGVASASGSEKTGDEEAFQLLNRVMRLLTDRLPAYVWYTALPQLVSRLCTPSPEVWQITKGILIKILLTYPSQAVWHVIGVLQSNVPERKSRAQELLSELVQTDSARESGIARSSQADSGPDLKRQMKAVAAAFLTLIRVAKHQLTGKFDPHLNLRSIRGVDLAETEQVFAQGAMSIPTQEALSAVLPRIKDGTPPGSADSGGAAAPATAGPRSKPRSKKGRPRGFFLPELDVSPARVFGVDVPLVTRLGAQADVMRSKERPKKVQLFTSRGEATSFLCKNESKGDLRKDSRTMEFTGVVNKLFQRDPQARKRKLRLRTYAVVCLNETCGLIEWVSNTAGFRDVVQRVYAEVGEATALPQLLAACRSNLVEAQRRNLSAPDALTKRFVRICEDLPPMTHKWFLHNFVEPESWMEARQVYTRSSAAWSMVGHIIGLGDRHAENVLIDTTTGEVVHVDFDCLFDKGLTLAMPELVPFRLTRHMVDGMDLCGVEGLFRRSCEVSLRVLRDNKNMLLSVLEGFVVDPLVEWTREKHAQAVSRSSHARDGAGGAKRGEREGMEKLRAISERLDGIVYDRVRPETRMKQTWDVIPLSTQGQVHRLIQEATSEDLLAQMFPGWSPYL